MTIKDLAARTGYSVGTVSRALNEQPNVSEKARRRILQTARECGFELNVNAKQLKQHSSSTILAIVKGTGNELFGEMVECLQNLIAATRYQLVVDYMDEDLNEVRRALSLCREKKPLGILFLGGNNQNFAQDFGRIDIPCVLVTGDASELAFPNLSSVSTDDREAARCAVAMLLSLGHRHIVLVGGSRDISDTSRLRYEGAMQALCDCGIPFDPERDYEGVRFSSREGYAATRALLERGCRFTALFAAADVIAIGAIRALCDSGLRVPEDVSVVGYDGVPVSEFLVPSLATVCQSCAELARRAVEILLSQIERKSEPRHEKIPFELRRRESVCPPAEERGDDCLCAAAEF